MHTWNAARRQVLPSYSRTGKGHLMAKIRILNYATRIDFLVRLHLGVPTTAVALPNFVLVASAQHLG